MDVLEIFAHTERMPTEEIEGSIFFIGNATVLLRIGGFTILTDPTFVHKHEQVSVGPGLHATRLTDPAVEIADLPPLDFVLLSHFHGDHFDQVAERELDRTLPILTTPEATEDLAKRGFSNTAGLDPWASITVMKGDNRLRITATPGRHGPGVTDLVLPDVMGSIIETEAGDSRLYISGDTLVYDDLQEIPRRYPEIDIGLFHLGGTRVLGLLVTMDADQGVEAVRLVNPRTAIPIHYDDYDLFTSPLSDFLEAASHAGIRNQIQELARGDTYTITSRD